MSQMKKALIAAVVLMVLPLCGCGQLYQDVLEGLQERYGSGQASPTATDQSGKGAFDDFEIEILDAKKITSFEGNDAVAVTYRWKNNSEETVAFFDLFEDTVFQDGIELEPTLEEDSHSSEFYGMDLRIRPGKSLDITAIYELRPGTPEIEVEVSYFSLFKECIVKKTFTLAQD